MVAYHLMSNDEVQGPLLAREWSELAADDSNPSVYRAVSPGFQQWLEGYASGLGHRHLEASAEPSIYVFPVGVWFRRRPQDLVRAAVEVARITHLDAQTAVAAAAVAGATAASCFAQTGRDLLFAAADTARRALALVKAEATFTEVERAAELAGQIEGLSETFGRPVEQVAQAAESEGDRVLAAIAVGARSGGPELVSECARLGGGGLGAMVGALVGARLGFRNWAAEVPNATWFMEIGKRLVSGEREVRDLPVPYFVEESLTHGIDRDYR